MWGVPPEEDAAFTAQMEQVLEVHKRPYDAMCPQVCMDEQPKHLIRESRPHRQRFRAGLGASITSTFGKGRARSGCSWISLPVAATSDERGLDLFGLGGSSERPR